MTRIAVTSRLLKTLALGGLVLLGACAQVPPAYNTAGSRGALLRQERGFDGNTCHYNNGVTVHTQGNCPPSVTSNVYQRAP